jgi:SAM-dependent methyltransferase
MEKYPKTPRNLEIRSSLKSPIDQAIARQFGREFFDGDRRHGYGGFNYNPKFWSGVVRDIAEYWNIKLDESLLDVGCAKGFMLFDFLEMKLNLKLCGLDISEYAIRNSKIEVKDSLIMGNAAMLPFAEKSFDYVISINTIHNLPIEQCIVAIKEIQRVCKSRSFIVVDAYESEIERERMFAWNLTAQTILSKSDWKDVFEYAGYTGDYYWFTP